MTNWILSWRVYFLTSRHLCKRCRKHVLLSLKCLSVDLINTTTYNRTKIRCWPKLCFFAFVKWLLYGLIATFVKVMQNLSKCIKRTLEISKDAFGSVLLNWTQDAFNELLCLYWTKQRKNQLTSKWVSNTLRITWPEQGSCLSVTTWIQYWFYKVRLTKSRQT